MRSTSLLLLALAILAGRAWADDSPATRVIQDYGKIAYPAEDPKGEFLTQRADALRKLKDLREADVLAAVDGALAGEKDERRRAELVEALRDRPSPAAGELLVKMLADSSAHVRRNAIHTLRLFAGRVDRFGGKRELREQWAKPKVEGLVPSLIKAADDPDETNRRSCLYALADTLDPAAVERIRGALTDASPKVRFYAACFLTEFKDASGIEELKAAVTRVHDAQKSDPLWTDDAERLVTSLERLAGKSFGRLPMNPGLMSDSRKAVEAEAEYARIIDAWAKWWQWEPPAPQ